MRESNGALVATKAIKNGVLATLPSDLALALCDPDEDEADHAACAKNFYEFKYEHQFGTTLRRRALGMDLQFAAMASSLRERRQFRDAIVRPVAPPTPINWSADEVEALSWPPLQEEINARKKRVDEVASEASLPADEGRAPRRDRGVGSSVRNSFR